LKKVARRVNEEMYGKDLKAAVEELRNNAPLAELRSRFQAYLTPSYHSLKDKSVLFLLNIMGRAPFMLRGGWISLVQEAEGLASNGYYVRIAVPNFFLAEFSANFPRANSAGLFLGFVGTSPTMVVKEVLTAGVVYDFVVATHATTAQTVVGICRHWRNSIPGYYVQDIESGFKESRAREAAVASYEMLRYGFISVKTVWLQQQLYHHYNISSHLIPPTVDTTLFTPGNQHYHQSPASPSSSPLHLCAMVRTTTPRKKPLETLQLLTWARQTFGGSRINITAFGSPLPAIKAFVDKHEESGSGSVDLSLMRILGVVDRAEIASLNRRCDVFLDFSTWQAFGRSGIEAMAGGVVPILPLQGGASQYAHHGHNAFLIDTDNDRGAKEVLTAILAGKYDLVGMRQAAIATAEQYSVPLSAATTSKIFSDFREEWRSQRASFVTATSGGGSSSSSSSSSSSTDQ